MKNKKENARFTLAEFICMIFLLKKLLLVVSFEDFKYIFFFGLKGMNVCKWMVNKIKGTIYHKMLYIIRKKLRIACFKAISLQVKNDFHIYIREHRSF